MEFLYCQGKWILMCRNVSAALWESLGSASSMGECGSDVGMSGHASRSPDVAATLSRCCLLLHFSFRSSACVPWRI